MSNVARILAILCTALLTVLNFTACTDGVEGVAVGPDEEAAAPEAVPAEPAPASPEPAAEPAASDPYAAQRERMVREDIASSGFFGRKAITDEQVLAAMRAVKRHEYVPENLEAQAYSDRPLPIGHGQTISQPYIVAHMTSLLQLDSDDVVFEVGTGSGYQAAVLAQIVDEVYTVEIVEALAAEAKERLARLGYDNVHVRQGDGYYGWPEHAPYDAIVVTAAASHIPPPLTEQLKNGGRMVIPVGPPLQVQQLMLVEKDAEGQITQRNLMPVQFVPFTRGAEAE